MLKEFGMEEMLKVPELSEVNIEEMASDMLKSNGMGIDLSSFDLNQFASMGELVTVKSKISESIGRLSCCLTRCSTHFLCRI